MTPTELMDIALRRYNATSDNFFPPVEVYDLIWAAEKEMATECKGIEGSTTALTVKSQRAYDYPTNFIEIVRVEYNGKKLKPISFREDDAITLSDSDTTSEGEPGFYAKWEKKIYLRPLPDSVGTLTFWGYKEPAKVLAADTNLVIPTEFQMSLLYYVLREMALKDTNPNIADRYGVQWDREVARFKKWMAKRRRGDSLNYVQDVDQLPNTYIGVI